MTKTIGAQGFIGVAVEDTPNTYKAPDKFFPIRNETLRWMQNTNQRRVIRGTADVVGAVPGNGHVEGNIDSELLTDVLPYFLLAARGTVTKTGASAPFTYEFVPAHNATAPHSLSITVVRGEEAFGYVGCVLAGMTVSVDNDMGVMNLSVLGSAEQSVAVPGAPAYGDDIPFGSGTWNLQVPTATQIFDADNFSFEVDDGGEPQNRLRDELGAQFIAFGERTTTFSVDRDFEDRDEYNDFKALTEKSITVQVQTAADNSVRVTSPAMFTDEYDVGLSGVGDLVRATVSYVAVHDDTIGGAYEVEIITAEDITMPV